MDHICDSYCYCGISPTPGDTLSRTTTDHQNNEINLDDTCPPMN